MTEATLTAPHSEALMAVGDYLGYGRNHNIWNREQTAQITRVMRSAERAFYEPKLVDQKGDVHVWSFLTFVTTLTLPTSTTTLDLPDTFGGFTTDRLAFASREKWPLLLVSMDRFLEKTQHNRFSGFEQPMLGTVQPKAFTASTGQRWTLSVWPTTVRAYIVSGPSRLNPNAVSLAGDYPMGGEAYAETLMASYLAAAELEKTNATGPLATRFMELLAASIAYDRGVSKKGAA